MAETTIPMKRIDADGTITHFDKPVDANSPPVESNTSNTDDSEMDEVED